jgi:hypothetical protein
MTVIGEVKEILTRALCAFPDQVVHEVVAVQMDLELPGTSDLISQPLQSQDCLVGFPHEGSNELSDRGCLVDHR